MTSVLKVDQIETVSGTGTITIPTGNTLDASSGFTPPAGSVVQVQTVRSDAIQTINSATPVAVTELSIDFTPKYADSQIIIQTVIHTDGAYVTNIGIYKDGTVLNPPTGGSGSTAQHIGISMFPYHPTYETANYTHSYSYQTNETSGSTTTRTYQVYMNANYGASTYAVTINDRGSIVGSMRSVSTMTVWEIKQ